MFVIINFDHIKILINVKILMFKIPFLSYFLSCTLRFIIIMSLLYTRDISSMMNGQRVLDQLARQQKFNPVSSDLYPLSVSTPLLSYIIHVISFAR